MTYVSMPTYRSKTLDRKTRPEKMADGISTKAVYSPKAHTEEGKIIGQRTDGARCQ
jgi:hypothetical protein